MKPLWAAPSVEQHHAAGHPVLVWRCWTPWLVISSAPYGGGLGERRWVLNATVEADFDHPDPVDYLAQLAEGLDLRGSGTGLLTAVDVRRVIHRVDSGVSAAVTTGLGQPTWAAQPDEPMALRVGTINVVGWLPVRLADAALVNAVATVAEAKAQALREQNVPGTGTCTDATVLLCPTKGSVRPYGGPRSTVGGALARAVHQAITAGLSKDRL